MSAYDFDLFVIGAGSGGVRAARIASGHGARVAIAEDDRIGGTCVIRGCVPKKLLVYASRFRDEFEDAAGFGWTVPEISFDWPALRAAKDKEIARLEDIYKRNLERSGVTIFRSRASLVEAHTIALSGSPTPDCKRVTADKILIATGGEANIERSLPGVEHTITSKEAFDLEDLPRRVVVAGGGYIAAEFAGIFNGLGAQTTLLYRGDKILRGFDDDLRDGITSEYEHRGINVVTNRVFKTITKTGSGLIGTLSDGSALEADAIMLAIGRSPNVKGLGLDMAGVHVTAAGAIAVDGFSKTSAENIYAIGDVTDRVNLTPVAIREGHSFADRVFGGKPWTVDYNLIPTSVFSTPELGTVGLSQEAARASGHELDIYKAQFRPMKATLSGRAERMLMKLVVDAKTGRVLGCHVLGQDAAEIVQMAAIAMRMGATKDDFDQTMALHPSAAEELVTMRDKWVPAG